MNQLTFDDCRARGTEAGNACLEKAERAGFDREAAANAILQRLEAGPLSGEELVTYCKELGLVPHDDRAFGSVLGALSRRGVIVVVGHTKRRRGHGTSGGVVWGLA